MQLISYISDQASFIFKRFSFFLLFLTASLIGQDCPSPLPDPYRWLEDDKDPRTNNWLAAQQQMMEKYAVNNPYRKPLKQSLQHLLKCEMYTVPAQAGNSIVFKVRRPGDNQAILYFQEGIDGEPHIVVDPNRLQSQTPLSISDYFLSPDGKWLVYGLSESGSDWNTGHVINLLTNESLNDRLENIKFFTAVWTPNSTGFYYTRLDSDDRHRIYFHRLSTSQLSDELIYEEREHLGCFVSAIVSSDNRYLLINVSKGSSGPNAILYQPLDEQTTPFVTLLEMKQGNYNYLCNEGPLFYFWTNQEADLGKVFALDRETLIQQDIIPESSLPMQSVVAVGDTFLVKFSSHASARLLLYDRQGNALHEISLPKHGKVLLSDDPSTSTVQRDTLFFTFTNFVQPPTIYHYNVDSHQKSIFKQPNLPFNPNDYETKQVFIYSNDGTQVPMFIVHKKGLELNGHHQTLLYGYGGFGISSFPNYNTVHMAWLESNGIFALANIRGGAEYGNQWHHEGKREKKQNSFDDFISAAEWLIDNGYTNSSKLAIRGASNGGLLTAVCANQRPDLFRAVLVEVGVLDMLRFHLFTVGHFWMGEYGDPDKPKDFQTLCRYSPYHNVRKGTSYPSVMVVTGDHDDRVVPLHSYKYTAALQEAVDGKSLVLLRVDKNGGHGAGKSVSQWIEEVADTLSFLKNEMEKSR